MTITTQSADGITHEFPDGTSPSVIDRVMKNYAQNAGAQPTAFQSLLNNPVSRGINDAVINPVMSLAGYGTRALDSLTSLGGTAPNPVSGNLAAATRAIASGQQGINSAFDQAAQAGTHTPGYAAARNAVQPVANYASAFGSLAPFVPAVAGTAAYLGQGANNLYREATGQPITSTAADASNAAADATKSNLDQYARANPGTMLTAQLAPAAFSLGAEALPSLTRAFGTKLEDFSKSIQAVRDYATQQYGIANRSPVVFDQKALSDSLNDLYQTQRNGGLILKPNLNSALYPKSAALLGEFKDLASKPATFQDVMDLRQMASDATGTLDKADAMRAYAIKDHIDDFVKNATPSSDAGAAAVTNAREAYARQAQAADIAALIDKAKLKAGANYTQAGLQQAVIRQFANLAGNQRGFSRLSPDMQAAVLKVVNGTGTIDNVARGLSKFAPKGVMTPMLEGGLGLGAYEAGGLPGVAAAASLPIAGMAARALSTSRTAGYANDAVRLALSGGKAADLATVPAARIIPAFRYSLASLPNVGLFGSGLANLAPQQQ